MAPRIKPERLALIILILLSGAAIAYHSANRYAENLEMKTYLIFSSANPALNFTFKYPPAWQLHESQGRSEPYDSVQVLGPRDEAREFSVNYSVTVKETDKIHSQLASEFIKSMERFSGFKTIKSNSVTIGGLKTDSITYEYIMRLPLRKINAQNVLMIGKTSFLVRGGKSYRLTFFGTREQFEVNEKIFNHALRSFKFLEKN